MLLELFFQAGISARSDCRTEDGICYGKIIRGLNFLSHVREDRAEGGLQVAMTLTLPSPASGREYIENGSLRIAQITPA
jgi:hypothetical protein